MISVTSITDKYILQPSLIAKHRASLEWISSTLLWKRELVFFQKLLDGNASKFSSTVDKKKLDHFQSIVTYYKGELIDSLSTKLRLHEKRLAEMLETRDETKTEYFKEHDSLMSELESFNTLFTQYKDELFNFIEKVL